MHAFLIVGLNSKTLQSEIDKLTVNLNSQTQEFAIKGIEDVRNLTKFTKYKIASPTIILIRNIHDATLEALNAFLKNLEEPQPYVNYILTADSEYKVLPTILSRCQVIKTKVENVAQVEKVKNFVNSSLSEKFSTIDKIKDRDEAVDFITEMILSAHTALISSRNFSLNIPNFLRQAHNTLNNLKANGNVGLQLTNFVVNL